MLHTIICICESFYVDMTQIRLSNIRKNPLNIKSDETLKI